jgi:hypothetical protein
MTGDEWGERGLLLFSGHVPLINQTIGDRCTRKRFKATKEFKQGRERVRMKFSSASACMSMPSSTTASDKTDMFD